MHNKLNAFIKKTKDPYIVLYDNRKQREKNKQYKKLKKVENKRLVNNALNILFNKKN